MEELLWLGGLLLTFYALALGFRWVGRVQRRLHRERLRQVDRMSAREAVEEMRRLATTPTPWAKGLERERPCEVCGEPTDPAPAHSKVRGRVLCPRHRPLLFRVSRP